MALPVLYLNTWDPLNHKDGISLDLTFGFDLDDRRIYCMTIAHITCTNKGRYDDRSSCMDG